jgi:hypothetical protein
MRTIQFAFALFGAGMLFLHCAPQPVPSPKQLAAEGAYTADLVACVEEAKTLAESKACRAEVNRRWGIVETRSAR